MPTDRENQIKFYETLALAITQWQHIELELYRIFLWCIHPEDPYVASAAFHTVINFNTRLQMTDAAAQIALDEDSELPSWEALRDSAAERSRRRNELVHFMTFHDATKERMRFRLVPSIFNVKAAGTKEYVTEDIERFRRDFGMLSQEMHEFANALFARRK